MTAKFFFYFCITRWSNGYSFILKEIQKQNKNKIIY